MKKRANVVYKMVTAMAFSRADWIDRMRKHLEGALGEYAKKRFANLLKFDFDWSPEIDRLLLKAAEMFDEKKTKLKSNFNLKKAFSEALREAATAQHQVLAAKNDFTGRYLKTPKEVERFLTAYRKAFDSFQSEKLIDDMIAEHIPKLLKYVK